MARSLPTCSEYARKLFSTFGPDGIYGHPDHIAISQFTTAAVVAAAGCETDRAPHLVDKLYYLAIMPGKLEAYESAMGELVMQIDGQERRGPVWKEWMITTVIHTSAYWEQVLQAVGCHATQITGYEPLKHLPERLTTRQSGGFNITIVLSAGSTAGEQSKQIYLPDCTPEASPCRDRS